MQTISFKLIPFLTGEVTKPKVYLTHLNYLNWRALKKSMEISAPYLRGKCLDIGSGNSPYKSSILKYVDTYICVDHEETHKHMFQTSKEQFINADIKALPFEDNSIDSIILTQVLEHIDAPFEALDEVKRVLANRGTLILSVPFIYQAHATPYDYFRFSEYALRHIAKQYNFEIKEFHYQGYLGTTLISILNGFLWQLSSKNKVLRNTLFLLPLLVVFSINNIFGLILDTLKLKDFTPNFWLVLESQ